MNFKPDYELLKKILSIPSKTFKEEKLIKFITEWLKSNDIKYYVDTHKNIYAEKMTNEYEYVPCVVCHTDTVHNNDIIIVKEEMLPNSQNKLSLSLKGYDENGNPTGIGGDDKCGVYACLMSLKTLDNIKAAFFVSEEIGCVGSKNADPDFFDDVGYVIQFDAPFDWMVSEVCSGEKLFKRDSVFFDACHKVLTENLDDRQEYMRHPYTDVYALRKSFDFSCINISIGYHDYHTSNEYVVVDETNKGIDIGIQMIHSLGNKKYIY